MEQDPEQKDSVKIYPPTETKDWDRCPIYRELRREGWEPGSAQWTPHRLLGITIGDALSECYRHWADPNPVSYGIPVISQRLEAGFVETSHWSLVGLLKLAQRGFEVACAQSIIPSGAVILAVEETVGVGRPDLVIRNPSSGRIETWDTKVSLEVDPRYVKTRLSEYETDHQVWHSAWTVSQRYGETVAVSGVQQLILSPRALYCSYPVSITEGRLSFWRRGAEQMWRDMAAEQDGTRPMVPRFSSCHGKFGRCVYHDWCHLFGGDPEKAQVYYTREGR